jgi:hypothetical protein
MLIRRGNRPAEVEVKIEKKRQGLAIFLRGYTGGRRVITGISTHFDRDITPLCRL